MSSLAEALASTSSASDLGPSHWREDATSFVSPEVLSARSVFLTQQSIASETRESLTTQWDRLKQAEGFHERALDSISWQKKEVAKLLKSAEQQEDATKKLGRELGYSYKLEQIQSARSNPLIDWFKSSTRLRGSDVKVEPTEDDGDAEVHSPPGEAPPATYAETLDAVAEPGHEWSEASDAANPGEDAESDDKDSQSWGVWTGKGHGEVQNIPVSKYGDPSGLDDPAGAVKDESEASVSAAEVDHDGEGDAKKRRLAPAPPKFAPPNHLRRIPPLAEPRQPKDVAPRGSVASAAKPKPKYPWRRE